MSRDIFSWIRLLQALSSLAWDVSRDGASPTSPGNPGQGFTTLSVKNFFLMSSLNPPSFNLKAFPLVLSLRRAVPASAPSRRSTAGMAASPNPPKGDGSPVPGQETCPAGQRSGDEVSLPGQETSIIHLLFPVKEVVFSPQAASGWTRRRRQEGSQRGAEGFQSPLRSRTFTGWTCSSAAPSHPTSPYIQPHQLPPRTAGDVGWPPPSPPCPFPHLPCRHFSPATLCHSQSSPASPYLFSRPFPSLVALLKEKH